MAESKVKKDNYVVIQGWMLSELGLKGSELVVYACIYGFSQTDDQWFSGSRQYLAEWTNSTKRSVQNALKSLVKKGLLIKRDKNVNGVKFCEYRAIRSPVVKSFPQGGEKISLPSEKISSGGSEKVSPNNIDINTINNNIEDNIYTEESCQQVIDLYHSICKSYPKVRAMSEKRKDDIKARFITYGLEGFKVLFEKAEASSFLKGFSGTGWRATFDWLIEDGNMAKVLDGNYDDRVKKSTAPKNSFNSFKGQRDYDFEELEKEIFKNEPKTAGEDEAIRARAEALRQQLGGV